MAVSKTLTHDFQKWVEFYQVHGAPERMSSDFKEIIKSYKDAWYALPCKVRRIQDNESILIDGRSWTVITGAGHTHEHASFWCEELNILISGDQILPRITSNISLWHTEPDGNPLKHYLESFKKYEELPADVLVLPSHDYPFKGLHGRLDDLRTHHQQRIQVTQEKCAVPRTAAEIIPYLFKREINAFEFSFAIGETLAHLNYLLDEELLECVTGRDGLIRYRSVK